MQMEGRGVQLVERQMGVDLQFTSTAGTVFWDDTILSRFRMTDRHCSQQALDESVCQCFFICCRLLYHYKED